jgi:hypothetical protein
MSSSSRLHVVFSFQELLCACKGSAIDGVRMCSYLVTHLNRFTGAVCCISCSIVVCGTVSYIILFRLGSWVLAWPAATYWLRCCRRHAGG